MLRKIRNRLSYANIVSTLALFLVLSGGTAVALTGSNTVFSDDIVDGHVANQDIAGNAVTNAKVFDGTLLGADVASSTLTGVDVATGGLTGSDVAENSLTGSDISEGQLALVQPCGPGAIKGSIRIPGSPSIPTSYTAGVGDPSFACRGSVRVRRQSPGVYHVCFANLALSTPSGKSVGVASASDNLDNYATAERLTGTSNDCDTANTAGDAVYEVTVLTDAGAPADGQFSLIVH